MFGTNIYLTHQLAQMQVRELLADAERQHSANIARAARARTRRSGIAVAQAGLATLLLRVGAWLIPPGKPVGNHRPVDLWMRTWD